MTEKMAKVTINGQELALPEEMSAEELLRFLGEDPTRHVLQIGDDGTNAILPKGNRNILQDGGKYSSAPIFKYGDQPGIPAQWAPSGRNWRYRRIPLEVTLLGQRYGKVEYDYTGLTWVHIPEFPLPSGWNKAETQLLIELPPTYPLVGPEGFSLDPYLRTRAGRTPAHYLEPQARQQRGRGRWVWFCLERKDGPGGGWRTAARILDGDNLLAYTELIRAVLSRPGKE
jgi:hypothetical protein